MHDARTGCAPSKAPRYVYTYGANKVTGVSMACDLYFCFLALCEVLRTCPSGIRPQQYYMLFITNNHVAYFIKFHFFCIKCYVILWKLKLLHISSLSFSGPRYSILPFGVQFFVHCLSSNISGCSFCWHWAVCISLNNCSVSVAMIFCESKLILKTQTSLFAIQFFLLFLTCRQFECFFLLVKYLLQIGLVSEYLQILVIVFIWVWQNIVRTKPHQNYFQKLP